MNSNLSKVQNISLAFIIGGIIVSLSGMYRGSVIGTFFGAFLAVMGSFLSALILLARYIKDESIITENGANSSCDDKKDVA